MSRLFVLVLVVVLALCLTAASAGAGGGSCYQHSKKDRALARKTNTARAKADVRKVSLDPHLSRVARRQAKAMARKGSLYHTPSLGSLITGWRALAENVGYSSSVKSVHRAFMSSPLHKANLLRASYRHLGIGVQKKGAYVWAVAVFESRKNPGTTLSMPSC